MLLLLLLLRIRRMPIQAHQQQAAARFQSLTTQKVITRCCCDLASMKINQLIHFYGVNGIRKTRFASLFAILSFVTISGLVTILRRRRRRRNSPVIFIKAHLFRRSFCS